MEREEVESSNLVSVGYNKEDEILEIEFKGGSIYQYFGVDKITYERFRSSDSLGSFVQKYLTKNFHYEKIN